MEELRQTAMSHYKIVPPEIREKVDQFFDTMDDNKDGTVSLYEFSSFMAQEGYELFNNPSFFDEICTEKSNGLNKKDVITLFYIIQSGRPLCDGCRRLIKGLYFTCETCFKDNGNSFDLHQDCLTKREFKHNHENFIDNFALLTLSRRKRLSAKVTHSYASNASSSSSLRIEEIEENPNSNSLAIVLAQQNHNVNWKRKVAYKALVNILTESIAYNCTIM